MSLQGQVKVDIHGRKGDFTNKLFIELQVCPNIYTDVTGKIVNDVWFSGQSIRQTARPESTWDYCHTAIGSILFRSTVKCETIEAPQFAV
ncbi:MAG: hypothetical protein LBT46_15215 [Planctomycetaceae bacterium]|jgi:hypothetical protein|nr:hypothetical protein [Planctomycetaceae bacterium]